MSLTFGQLQDALEASIAATLPDDDEDNYHYVYVADFTDSMVIYATNGEYFQDDYTIDEDDQITLAGKPVAVWPSTTYVPLQSNSDSAPEHRGHRVPRELRGMGRAPAPPKIRVKAEPLTYHRHSRASYFQDLVLRDLGMADRLPGTLDRLRRHDQERDVIAQERERRAWSSLRAGGLEYRVEPNPTVGQGGNFAPPLWLNELFAEGKRPERVLADLIPGRFELPMGVSSINVPVIGTGTTVAVQVPNTAVSDTDITDAAGSSTVVLLSGQEDIPLQLLEQSPQGAHMDAVMFQDLTGAYDADLEAQLLNGLGVGSQQLLGVMNATTTTLAYTSASPTGPAMWPYFGQAVAQLADGRELPPQVWLLRTARWAWLSGQEDNSNRPLGLPSPFFMGNTPGTPDPITGLYGFPAFLDEAIPATLGTGGNQDAAIVLRPSDLILLEGAPRVGVKYEPGSGNLGARVQLSAYAAAITNRFIAGIVVVGGTGFVVQSNY